MNLIQRIKIFVYKWENCGYTFKLNDNKVQILADKSVNNLHEPFVINELNNIINEFSTNGTK